MCVCAERVHNLFMPTVVDSLALNQVVNIHPIYMTHRVTNGGWGMGERREGERLVNMVNAFVLYIAFINKNPIKINI